MTVWVRLAITVAVMVLVSFLAAWLWNSLLGVNIPSYISGLIGGLIAIPVWEILQKFKQEPHSKK